MYDLVYPCKPYLDLSRKGFQKRGVIICKEDILGRTDGKLCAGGTLIEKNKKKMPKIGKLGKGILLPSKRNSPFPNGKYYVILQPH